MAERTSPDIEAQILEGNRQGKSGQAMAAELGMSKSVVCRILKRHGIEAKIGRPAWLALDHTVFDSITPESAYWMGFLFADGTVGAYGDGAPTIRLDLAEKDRGHVEKFRSFLKSGHKIITVRHPTDGLIKTVRVSASLSVRSEQLVANLEARGLAKRCPDRTPTPEIENSTDFWRGMIDGDGTVRENVDRRGGGYRYASIMLCGHIPVLEKFQTFLLRRGISANIIDTTSGIFQIRMMGASALTLIRDLYENAVVALDRKLETARGIMESHSR